jgi:5'-nucleotidase
LGTALVAPLATSSGSAGAITISGANSLADKVSVQFKKPKERTTDIHLLAWNDLHGNLEAASLNIYGKFAGGAAYLAKLVKDRQAQYGDHQLTVFGGDNIGASPLASALFHDEPITVATNLMNADFGSVGNHEFDEGREELLRMQNGGCHPVDGCHGPYALAGGGTTDTYPGADFQYLAANVIVHDTGQTLFPAYGIKRFKSDSGPKFTVGIIGEVLKDTPTIVTPSGVEGLDFIDEADAANKAVKELQRKGVNTNILVIHQGGFQTTAALNGCAGNLAGSDITKITDRLDPSIKVIVSAHTHAEYRCTITNGGVTRLITSASSFGRILSDLTLTIDDKSGELVQASADNAIVENALNTPGPGVTRIPDPSKEDGAVKAVVDQYVKASAPLSNQVIGSITADLTRAQNAAGEMTMGEVIADSQLEATVPVGAQVALMNPGGVRADMLFNQISTGGEAPGEITYGEAFTVQPFGNSLVTKTMTGAQIKAVLEQQIANCNTTTTTDRILQVSAGFSYTRTQSQPCGSRISGIALNGTPVDPAATYKVTMNSFLATGGDGFTVFNQGTNPVGGDVDIDAQIAYFGKHSPVAPPPLNRITFVA